MNTMSLLAFVVYPYVVIVIFFGGHAYRYATDLYHWNSRSSELLHKKSLEYGITLFHWGIIFTFLGHFFGLLTPQSLLDRFGISAQFHEMVAVYTGMFFGTMAFIGLIILLIRRFRIGRIAAVSSPNDVVVVAFLLIVVALGTYNTYFQRFSVVTTIAPWIQSIVSLHPRPELMDFPGLEGFQFPH
ncbi:MAG: respiratory nitrate reductase subunit gamma [Deltaproteobacteria bacterium]